MAATLTSDVIGEIVSWIPEAWLIAEPGHAAGTARRAYARFLLARLAAPRPFVEEALRAR